MTLEEQQNYAGQQNCGAGVVETRGELVASLAFCCLESLESGSCQVSRNAGVAARGVSSANLFAGLVAHAGNIMRLDGSSVVSARGWGRENSDLLAAEVELERVLGVDSINCGPTEVVAAQRVYNLDTFVAENNLRANVDQPGARTGETADTASNKGYLQVAFEQHLNEYANENCPDYAGEDVTGAWAEGFDVVHRTIFSQSFTETLSTTEGRK